MNEFRIRATGAVVSEQEFRALHAKVFPGVIDKATATANGADPVLSAPPPTTGDLHIVVRDGAVLDGLGNWVQGYRIVQKFQNPDDEAPYLAGLHAERVAAAWERIKAERERRKGLGVKVGDKWFHSDDASRIQQIGLTIAGPNIPPGLQWKTLDGTFVTMTQTLAGQIFVLSMLHDQEIFARAESHRVAMEASENPSLYDFSSDWPSVFVEQLP